LLPGVCRLAFGALEDTFCGRFELFLLPVEDWGIVEEDCCRETSDGFFGVEAEVNRPIFPSSSPPSIVMNVAFPAALGEEETAGRIGYSGFGAASTVCCG
jgi:hypothetical protein